MSNDNTPEGNPSNDETPEDGSSNGTRHEDQSSDGGQGATDGSSNGTTPGDESLEELMERLRKGDVRAADEIWRRFEPVVRSIVKVRETQRLLRRYFDSEDIAISIFSKFLDDVKQGRYQGGVTVADLKAQLVTRAWYKFLGYARQYSAARRDARRQVGDEGLANVPSGTNPGEEVAHQEWLMAVRQRLPVDKRCHFDRLLQGDDWKAIAEGYEKKPVPIASDEMEGPDTDASRQRADRIRKRAGRLQVDFEDAIERVLGEMEAEVEKKSG